MQQTAKYKFNLPNDTKDAFSTAPLNENMEKLDAELARLSADLGTYGANVRLMTGAYVGTGTAGSRENATVLPLERYPEVLFVIGSNGYWGLFFKCSTYGYLFDTYGNVHVTGILWGEDGTLSWYYGNTSPSLQLNAKMTYTYLGLYPA